MLFQVFKHLGGEKMTDPFKKILLGLKNIIENQSLVEGHLKIKDIASNELEVCLLYTSPSPRDLRRSRMPSSA